jgi:hypothetical protein
LIDATVAKEPGKTGSQWRTQYIFQWPTLACDYFTVTATEGKGTGESLRHFPLKPQDHILVDRGYCHASGIHYVASKSAFVTVCLNPDGIILHSTDGAKFGLLEQLKSIKTAGQTGEGKILIPFEDHPPVPVRLCVIRKSQTAIALAHKKLRRYASKHRTRLQPETLLYAQYVMVLTTFPREEFSLPQILQSYRFRWQIGASSQGHINQPVKVRPRLTDSSLVAWEASWSESETMRPSDNMLRKEYAQLTRLQRAVNVDVASLHRNPVAETVDNVRKQQEPIETSPMRRLSPAGYQRRHGEKENVATGEALGARRRNLVEKATAITASGKCRRRRQGGGSGRITVDGRAAKHVRREGPGPVSIPYYNVRQG